MVDIAVHTGMTPDLPVSAASARVALDRGWRATPRRRPDRRRQERRPAASRGDTADRRGMHAHQRSRSLRYPHHGRALARRSAPRSSSIPPTHRVRIQAANDHDHIGSARARRQDARLIPRRRTTSRPLQRDHRLDTRRLQARRASGRRRCPWLSEDGCRGRGDRANDHGQDDRSPWRQDLHGLSEPHRHRKSADGRRPGQSARPRSSTPPASRRSSRWATCSTAWARRSAVLDRRRSSSRVSIDCTVSRT